MKIRQTIHLIAIPQIEILTLLQSLPHRFCHTIFWNWQNFICYDFLLGLIGNAALFRTYSTVAIHVLKRLYMASLWLQGGYSDTINSITVIQLNKRLLLIIHPKLKRYAIHLKKNLLLHLNIISFNSLFKKYFLNRKLQVDTWKKDSK